MRDSLREPGVVRPLLWVGGWWLGGGFQLSNGGFWISKLGEAWSRWLSPRGFSESRTWARVHGFFSFLA